MTDEWHAYDLLSTSGRGHSTVNHLAKEWARDDDGDGERKVHTITIEGHWTGLRNFLRMFRCVHKRYLGQYVAFYQGMQNFKDAACLLLGTLLGPSPRRAHELVLLSPGAIATTQVAGMIVAESALSYLGVGVVPPAASWGSMLQQSESLTRVVPRLTLVPGLAILMTVVGFNLLGEALRDAVDPRR